MPGAFDSPAGGLPCLRFPRQAGSHSGKALEGKFCIVQYTDRIVYRHSRREGPGGLRPGGEGLFVHLGSGAHRPSSYTTEVALRGRGRFAGALGFRLPVAWLPSKSASVLTPNSCAMATIREARGS